MGQKIAKSQFKNYKFPVLKDSNKFTSSYPFIVNLQYMVRASQSIKQNQGHFLHFKIIKSQLNSTFMKQLYQIAADLTLEFDYFIPKMNMYWYDTLVLTKFPCRFYKTTFESTMNRSNLLAVFQIKNKQQSLIVGLNTVHLQSLNNQQLRIKQLQSIKNINQNVDIVIVAGDFNFSDNYKEDKLVQQQYIDIWKLTKSEKQECYTMPKTTRFDQWRPDHIVIKQNSKSKAQFLKNAHFDISKIGDFTIIPHESQKLTDISKDDLVRCPSDHFGLFCKISFWCINITQKKINTLYL